jgi:hypothetical protein
MLEREIELVIDRITERTISRRDAIMLREVLASDIPRPVKVYLRSEVVRWLHADLRSAPRYGRVNRNAPGLEQLTLAFLRSLADAYQFSRTDFISIIDDAVHFVQSYACRPQWTLQNFVFDRATVLPVDEVLARLEYTYDYAYFKRLIARVIAQWKWREVRLDDFRLLVTRIDAQIVKQHSPEELAMLTKPIYDFVTQSDSSAHRAITVEPLLVFFEDKHLLNLKGHIEAVCRIRGRSELTMSELGTFIGDVALKSPEGTITPDRETLYGAPEGGSPEGEGISEAQMTIVDAEIAAGGGADAQESDPLADTPTAPPLPAPGLPDLAKMIPSKSRTKFIRKIFKKDGDYYSAVIAELNAAATWQDASAYLRDFFALNKLDPFAEVVVEFTDFVHSRYGTSA